MKSAKKKDRLKRITSIILLVTLVLSIIYIIIKIADSPSNVIDTGTYEKVKSDYVLMLLQCLLGLFLIMVPSIIERKFSIDIPNIMEILYFVFLYCAIYLGEVRRFYYIISYWDTILHAFSGAMLGALGFSLVGFLNNTDQVKFELSPFFIASFAFCFALAAGAIWEIYEYSFDGLLSLNMQKYALEDGTLLIGRQALSDTMTDIIIDALSALSISIAGYCIIKKRNYSKKYTSISQ